MRLAISLVILAAAAGAQGPPLPPDYAARVAELESTRAANPKDLRVLEALAGSYTMAGDYSKAIEALRAMANLTASDFDALAEVHLRIARNQAWSGDTTAAIQSYETYLEARPQDRKATIELIRLRRYRGDYSQAEALCDRLLAAQPDDAKVLALKAEVLHWAGNRRFLAQRTAARAAYLAPNYPDAKVAQVYTLRDLGENRAARREFHLLADQVARRGGLTAESTFGDAYRLLEQDLDRSRRLFNAPAYSVYNDSDGIRNVVSTVSVAAPFRDDHRFLLDFGHYRSTAPLGSVFTAGREASFVNEFSAGGMFRAAPGVSLTMLGGASRRSGGVGPRPMFDFRVAATPIDRWTFDFAAGREFLNVTPRAIDLDMSSYKLGGGIQYAFDSRTSLSGRAERRYWSDDNRSIAAEGTLRRILRYHRPFMIDAGLLTRWESFDRDTRFASGFFTPEKYYRHDAFLGLHGELGRRLTYEVRGAAGAQQLARSADYRSAWEFASSATLRLTRSLSLYGQYQRRNYSLLSHTGWYQGFYVSLGIRP